MPGRDRQRRRHSWQFVAILLLAALLGGLMMKKYLEREAPIKPVPPVPAQHEGVRSVVLFFGSPDGSGLVREVREIDPCANLTECADEVIGELINGPLGDNSPTLPETATFHGVNEEGDILAIDFGKEFVDGVQSGSNAEMAAVYSVVDTLAFNFPQVKRVRFLVEGKPIDTLKGHLDLREPLQPDFSIEKKQEPPTAQPQPAPKRRQP